MCRPSIVLWCYVLLLVASSSDSLENSTNNNEQRDNLTMHDFFISSTQDRNKMHLTMYNLHENSTKNDDEIQYESHINSNDHKDSARYKYHEHIMNGENNQMSMESHINSTEINDKNDTMLQAVNENLTKIDREDDSTSYELHKKLIIDDDNNTLATIVSSEACNNEICIQLCCPFGERLIITEKKCVAGQDNYSFPDVYLNDSENKKLNELFQLTVRDPCNIEGNAHRFLNVNEYSFLVNGSLYRDPGEVISTSSYCLGILNRDIYDVISCTLPIGFPVYVSICLLVSLPFLLLTFVVYSILPEVQNIHSYTLRVHVGSIFVSNLIIFCVQEIPELAEWEYCIPLAYIFHISMLSSCFWSNVISFDIWWTFRKCNLQQPDEKDKKKKFMIYSIYAWGVIFTLTLICAIMEYVPGPKDLIRPKMCTTKFWINYDDVTLTAYYYAPTGVAFISNICFFVATTRAILYHNKCTAHQLRDSESRRYNKKKRKFAMYLKLFIVMGVGWSLGIILWLINAKDTIPSLIWHISYTIDILQGVFIFIIYVCKKKILRLLLKRFGYQDRGLLWNISPNRQGTRTSSTTSYVSSISGSISMKNINPPISQPTNHISNVT